MLSTSAKFLTLGCLFASTLAAPVHRREVPQEHSHEKFLTVVTSLLTTGDAAVVNPLGIQDAVFGLLGNAAGAKGAGLVTDVTCLQQETADQAFTNAKAAGDIDGMTAALVYRALERNTGSVGLKSDLCESVEAVNPEIAALTQHQDPASDGAAEFNKALALELAKQIASIGGDPLIALESGTFAPGDVDDPTGAGNSCDDVPDPVGCIFTKNLLVPDASEDEIAAAVAGVDAAGAADENAGADAEATATVDAADAGITAAADEAAAAATETVTVTVTVTADAAADTAAAENAENAGASNKHDKGNAKDALLSILGLARDNQSRRHMKRSRA